MDQRTPTVCKVVLGLALGLLPSGGLAYAGSAAWFTPNSVNWNQPNNWTPATVPNGAADTATFYSTNMTTVSLSSNTEVNRIIFTSDAALSPYTITTSPAVAFTISGVGITNNSGVTQNFVTAVSGAFAGLTRFTNSASAGADTHTVFTSNGGGTSGFGGGTTQFKDTSTAGFAVFNANAGAVNGALGGIIEFRDNATGGNGKFTAKGGAITNAVGGTVQFFDSATAGSGAFTTNGSSVVNGNGALTQFFNSSTGGLATFINNGGTAFDASGGITQFLDTSTAGNGIFTNNGNTTSDFFGLTRFRNSATAGTATFNNNGGGLTYFSDSATADNGIFNSNGGTASNANGGATEFFGTSTAGNATFNAYGGTVSGANGGVTYFADSSTAGNGTFTAYAGAVSGANIGMTQFSNSSTAGSSSLINQPSMFYNEPGGLTQFNQTSTAGTATILNARPAVDGTRGGKTEFLGSASAGSSAITNQGGGGVKGGELGGETDFHGNSTAGAAAINNLPALTFIGVGGSTWFYDSTNAGAATIFNAGGTIDSDLNSAGRIFFVNTSSAGAATITNLGATVTDGYGGGTDFAGTTADNATIINEAGTGGGFGGYTQFYYQVTGGADAGSATIINRAPTSGNFGGFTTFFGSSAGTSTITAEGSAVAGESYVEISDSTAANSTLKALGATAVDGRGGRVSFFRGSAANATLIAESGTVPGAPGGRFIFTDGVDGGTARAMINAGGTFDISGQGSDIAGMSIGSIEGGGNFFLGSKELTAGGNGASTEVSGVISDGGLSGGAGGSLVKTGAGILTLSGANTYTGGTIISQGSLAVNGSVIGAVTVNSGATLQGNGTVGGLVTVANGGTLSPGNSPGTLTMGALTLNSGATTKIELAGTAAGAEYDQLHVDGPLSLDGALQVVLTAFSPAAGDSFDILDWATLSGTFSTLDLPSVKGGLTWNTDRLYVDGSLAVGGVVGDYNHDGTVDAGDYIIWRKTLGSTTSLDADGNGNLVIDSGDLDVWRAQFGQTAGGSGASAIASRSNAAVPEPRSALLLLLGIIIVGSSIHCRTPRCGHRPASTTSKQLWSAAHL